MCFIFGIRVKNYVVSGWFYVFTVLSDNSFSNTELKDSKEPIFCSFYTTGLFLTGFFNRPFGQKSKQLRTILTGPMDKNFPVVIKFIFKIIKFGDEYFKIRRSQRILIYIHNIKIHHQQWYL